MARLLVKKRSLKDTYDKEIRLCIQNVDIVLGAILLNTIGRINMIIQGERDYPL